MKTATINPNSPFAVKFASREFNRKTAIANRIMFTDMLRNPGADRAGIAEGVHKELFKQELLKTQTK